MTGFDDIKKAAETADKAHRPRFRSADPAIIKELGLMSATLSEDISKANGHMSHGISFAFKRPADPKTLGEALEQAIFGPAKGESTEANFCADCLREAAGYARDMAATLDDIAKRVETLQNDNKPERT